MSSTLHPTGFRVSDRPVAASFAHPYSFQHVDNLLIYDDARIPSSPALGGSEGSWVRYWDETATISLLEFEVKEKPKANPGTKDKRAGKKTKG
jgi:RNA-binding protein 5/10